MEHGDFQSFLSPKKTQHVQQESNMAMEILYTWYFSWNIIYKWWIVHEHYNVGNPNINLPFEDGWNPIHCDLFGDGL
jgi:hypothetical protein